MNTVMATSSHAILPLVTAGEALFSTLSGKPLSDNATKITAGVTSLLDGLLPVLAEHVPFDLGNVLSGATEVLTGLDTAISAAKRQASSLADTSLRASGQTGSATRGA